MFNLKFVIINPSKNLLILRFSYLFRIFFYGLGLFIFYFVFQDSEQNNSNVGPYVFIMICVLLGSYHESWTVDKSRNIIEQRLGLLFLFKRKQIPLSDLVGFTIAQFDKGSHLKSTPDSAPQKKYKYPPKKYQKLSMVLKDGKYRAIEIVQGRELDTFKRKAEKLAQFCDCPLTIE